MHEAERPPGPVDSRRAWLITWTVLFGAFCVAATITILAVSRPRIAADLGAAPESLVWLISGPTMAFALTGTLAGKLGDLYGHRRVYLIGMLGAAVFSALAAAAWSGGSLIGARIAGAALGSAAGPSSMAVISLMFPPERRARALGYWSLVVAGGPVVGLVVGAPLVEAFGWRWIFIGQVPLLLIALGLAWFVLPETPRQPGVTFDVPGQLALAVALIGLLLGIDRGRAWGWGSAGSLALYGLAVAATAVFIAVERRVRHPLVPLRYFARIRFTVPIGVQFFTQFGYMGGFILAPKLLADVRGLSESAIAGIMVPRPLTFAVAGPLAGYLAARLGGRFLSVFGTGMLVVSMAMMGWVAPDPATGWVMAAIALSGLGMGAAQPVLATAVANAVDDRDLGVAGAASQLVAQIGSSVGMNLLDSLQYTRAATVGAAAGYRQVYLLGALVTAVGCALAFRVRSTPRPVSDTGADTLEGGAVTPAS